MRRSASAFTMTELVVVMTVTMILSGMAVSSLSWLGSARQNVGAARIRTTLVFAQEWALGSGNRTWVTFDAPSDAVKVSVENPLNPGKAGRLPMRDPLTRAPMGMQLGENGVGIDSVDIGGRTEIEFDADGVPHDASGNPLTTDATIRVTGGSVIRVTRNTGLVTVN